MDRWAASFLVVCVIGCGARESAPTIEPAPARETERETIAGASCGVGLVLDLPATVAREWNGSLSIGGRLEGSVRWCGEGSITLESATLASASAPGGSVELAWDPEQGTLASGASLALAMPAPGALGRATLVVRAGAIEVAREIEIVDDPDRAAAVAACDAAGGTFRAMGIVGSELCDAPTRDAGARCLSSADCEGACVFDHTETAASEQAASERDSAQRPVSSGSAPSSAARRAGRCAPGEVEQTMVGRCHDRTHLFGCHPRLDEPRVACARPGLGARAHTICTD